MFEVKEIEIENEEIISVTSPIQNKIDLILSAKSPNQSCCKFKANLNTTSKNIIDKILYIENVLSTKRTIKELTSCRVLKEEVEKSLSNLNISSLSQDFNLNFGLIKKSSSDKNPHKKLEKCMKKVILVLLIFAFCAFMHLVLCDFVLNSFT